MNPLPDSISTGAVEIFGAVLVALIAGIFSLVGLIVSKENKLSDFRQAWIDALREDISLFVSHAINISAYFQVVIKPINVMYTKEINEVMDQQRKKQLYEEHQKKLEGFLRILRKDFSGINVCSTRIKLRLNNGPHEIDANSLLREMKKLETIFNDLGSSDDKLVHNIVEDIEIISRPLLKKEWERVKDGEPAFKIAKKASIIFTAIFVIFIVAFIFSVPAYLFGGLTASRRISEQPNTGALGQISIRQQVEPSSCSPAQVAKPANK